MSSVTVSVIITCYNSGEWIAGAVASIEAQTFSDYEIIIVDDVSPDQHTKEVLRSLETKPKVRVLHHEVNFGGPAKGRNTGIRAAKGRYFANLDADDRYAPDYLRQAVEVLDKKPEIGAVIGSAQYFGNTQRIRKHPCFHAHARLFIMCVLPATSIFRHVCWEQVGGYDEKIPFGYDDWEFWIGILGRGWKVHNLKALTYAYHVRTGALSGIGTDATYRVAHHFVYHKHRKVCQAYFWHILLEKVLILFSNPDAVVVKASPFRYACMDRGWFGKVLYRIMWLTRYPVGLVLQPRRVLKSFRNKIKKSRAGNFNMYL